MTASIESRATITAVAGICSGTGRRPDDRLRAVGAGRSGPADPTVAGLAAFAVLVARYGEQDDLRVIDFTGDDVRELTFSVEPDATRAALLATIEAARERANPLNADEAVATPAHGVLVTGDPEQAPTVADLALVVTGSRDAGSHVGIAVRDDALREGVDGDQLASCFATLFDGLVDVAAGDASVASLDLLADAERERILFGWNDTSTGVDPVAVPERIARLGAARPHATALSDVHGEVTFGELESRVARLAGVLSARGVRAGDYVAVVLERSALHVVAQLAIFRLGAAVVLVDVEYPPDRVALMLSVTGVEVVLSDPAHGKLAGSDVVVIDANDAMSGDGSDVTRPAALLPEQVSHVAFTSGSTGVPKAVLLRHGPFANTVDSLVAQCGIDEKTRGSWMCSPGFGLVEVDFFPVLAAGGSVHVPDPVSTGTPESLRDWLVARRIDHSLQLTAMAERLWTLDWPADTVLRWMLVAGERVRAWPGDQVPYRVLNVYGSAEANVVATCDLAAAGVPGGRRDTHGVPIGRPVPNVRLYVLDEAFRPVPPGVRGELYVSGASLSAGYLARDDETAASFLVNPIEGDPHPVLYRTGDSARYWADGTVEIIGRRDDELKIRDYRVHPSEIEALLSAQPGVRQCAVVPDTVAPGEKRLIAYIERDPSAPPTIGALRSAAGQKLPPWMRPAAYVIADLPSTANGKIDRAALPEPPRTRPDVTATFTAPRTETESALARLWADVLGFDEIGVHDDFLELGGDSLLAMRLLTEIHRELGTAIEMADLLSARSVAATARVVAGRGREDGVVPALGDLPTIEHDAAGRFEPFSLSETQQALWIGRGSEVDFGDVGCHGYFEWERDGLDPQRFRRAWARLLERHDMLRTVITPQGEQRVLEELPGDGITVLDLRDLPADEAQRQADDIRAEMSHQVMEPSTWPLYDVRLTQLPSGVVRLHVGIDLLLMDAWSAFQVLFPDLIEFYEDPAAELPALGVGFRDYMVHAQRILHASDGYARAERYWRERIPTLPAAPDLPTRSTTGPVRFERREHIVAAQRWAGLKESAKANGITPNGFLVAVFSEVLRAWSRNERFTINFPIFERWPLHPDIERVLGDFTNTVLVAVEKTDGTFVERARDIQAQLWTDMDHRQFNGVEVLRELTRHNGGALRPAMPVVVTSLLGHPPRRHVSALGRETHGVSQTPQVTLDFQIREIDDDLHFKWDHLGELFSDGVIDAMFDAYCALLDELAEDAAAWDRTRFPLVPSSQQAVREFVNDTEAPVRDLLLQDLLAVAARRDPDHEAVVDTRRRMSYQDLHAEANQIGWLLRDAGVKPGELVGIVTEKGWESYPAVYGALASGAAYLPIDAGVPDDRLSRLLRLGGVRVVLTQPWLVERLSWPSDVTVLAVGRDGLDRPTSELPPAQCSSDPAYVIYTSGSTGEPKGVTVDHRGVVNMVDSVNGIIDAGRQTRAFGIAGLHFDMSVYDVFGVVAAGGTVVLPAPFREPDPDAWLDLVGREKVTFWSSVPQLAEMLVTREEVRGTGALESVRCAVLSGDFLPLDLPDRLRALAPAAEVFSAGGPTETICWSIMHRIGEVDRNAPSIPYGVPIANQRYHIVDERLDHRPDWAVGEMVVASDVGLAHGYWRDPERSAQQFFLLPSTGERVYATGDLGRYLPDGSIEIVGRDDFQVKVLGYRIELGEIEAALASQPQVHQGVVVAPASPDGRRRLVAFVVEAGGPVDAAALSTALSASLPAYMVPSDIRVVSELPLTGNGKVDRRTLETLAAASAATVGEQDSPATALELLVGNFCADIIGSGESVPPTANFFAAGGDSLTGTRLVNRIAEVLGVEVSLRLVFTTPTIGDLCTAIAGDPETGASVVDIAEALVSLTEDDVERLLARS